MNSKKNVDYNKGEIVKILRKQHLCCGSKVAQKEMLGRVGMWTKGAGQITGKMFNRRFIIS